MRTRLIPLPNAQATAGALDNEDAPTCESFDVGGTRFRHSAAQFWPRLVDEVREAYPDCTRILLETMTAERLDPARLDPLAELQRDVDALAHANMEDVMRETVAQLALLGPPGLVRVRLLAGRHEQFTGELPADAVDAEGFIYLAAWLLEWARIPHQQWQQDTLEGQLVGRDFRRRIVYHLRFDTTREHVKEGLHRLHLTIDARVVEE